MTEPKKHCDKKCYESRSEAKAAMKKINKEKHWGLTNVYYCGDCCAYHTTSMGKQSSRDFSRYLKNRK